MKKLAGCQLREKRKAKGKGKQSARRETFGLFLANLS
jgi:hypothetical protein